MPSGRIRGLGAAEAMTHDSIADRPRRGGGDAQGGLFQLMERW
jgi:hypothetical protein